MPTATALTGQQVNPDGPTQVIERSGSYGELIVSNFNGFYFEQTQRGNGYCATSVAAALGVAGNNNPTLWNPSDSNNIVVITRVAIGWDTVGGGPAMRYIQYATEAGMGSGLGTAAPISAFTATPVPVNCLIGSPKLAKTKFAGATCTFTTAPTVVAPTGFSQSATVSGFGNQIDDVHGRICLWPGTIFQVCATGSPIVLSTVSIWFLELPKPTLSS